MGVAFKRTDAPRMTHWNRVVLRDLKRDRQEATRSGQ
jgi:hypothetical protein